jgi:hypothetical protein
MPKLNEERTPEQVQKSISACFDSVNLINETLSKPKTEKTADLVERNFKHCELMLSKDWFVEGLTGTQKTDIETVVSSGKAYIA